MGANEGAGGQVKNHWCTSRVTTPSPRMNISSRTTVPSPGCSTIIWKASVMSRILGTCSRKLPLVGSGFSRTKRQNLVKFVQGVPMRRR